MLRELRQSLADEIENPDDGADLKSLIYLGETLTAPCAVVTPGQPYLDVASGRRDVMQTEVLVRLDVLLLVNPAPAKTAAARIDDLIERVYPVLVANHHVTRITRPGTTAPIGGTKYVGAVISVEEIQKEPA